MQLTPDNLVQKSAYRPDIDGLRAVAVIAVVLNHLNQSFAPLGYLGVDIFFVISGFVITSSTRHRVNEGMLQSWTKFYVRRFKRLFPALSACVLITSILICLFDPSPIASIRTGISSLFAVSNLYLFKQATDYYGTWAELNAFTHTWSLGVEEQFYLFFPIILWFARSRPGPYGDVRLIKFFLIASICSVLFYIYISTISQPAAFFLLPSRLYEIGTGVLLYFLATSQARRIVHLARAMSPGFLLIILVGLFFIPLRNAVLPTIAAVVLSAGVIITLRESTIAYRCLTFSGVQYIGRISYSLYLWHWPVIVLGRWTIGASYWSLLPQVSLIVFFAAVSYHLIEKPLRRAEWSKSQVLGFSSGALLLLSPTLVLLFLERGNHAHLFSGARIALISQSSKLEPPFLGTVVLVGDSHAGQLTHAIENIAAQSKLKPILISHGATPFPTVLISSSTGGLTLSRVLKSAEEMNSNVQDTLSSLNLNETNVIILSSFYRFYFEAPLGTRKYQVVSHYNEGGDVISAQQALKEWLLRLREFAEKNTSLHIVIILSTPEMPGIYPQNICRPDWFRPQPNDKCNVEVDRQLVLRTLAGINSRIKDATSRLSNVLVFDPFPVLCPPTGAVCRSSDGDDRIYADEDHLTEAGSRRIEASLLKFLIDNKLINQQDVQR